jgi:hypothetical protein
MAIHTKLGVCPVQHEKQMQVNYCYQTHPLKRENVAKREWVG